MRLRRFRRVAAASALLAGATGIVANAALVLFFVLSRPWQPDQPGRWEWLGPANDIVGSISMAALVPVIAYLWSSAGSDRLLGVLSAGAGLSAVAFGAAGPMLVAGAITLETQFVVAGLGLPVIFGWLWRAGRAANLAGVLPVRTARLGELVGVAALAATGLAAVGAVLPAGSAAQYLLLGLAALPGLPAYLTFPVWQVLAGRAWWRPPPNTADQSRACAADRAGSAPL